MAPRKKKAASKSAGLDALAVVAEEPPKEIVAVSERVVAEGGAVLARYRDPLGGLWLVLASLPIDRIAPTPYQRELSDTHVKRLIEVIPKVGRFLDPVIAVPAEDGFWTPNGMHRLNAMKTLGAKAIIALIVPEPEIALRILALNTEKAHNLKDKSLEVMRMERGLAAQPAHAKRPETDFAFEFEEPAYPTVGLCYEARPRFAGGAYLPVLKRCEEFSDLSLTKAIAEREDRARRILELDDEVMKAVDKLKEAGLRSPYLKAFVIARINPLRFVKAPKVGEKSPRASFDATLGKMLLNVKKLDASKVRQQDLASMAGAGAAPDEA